MTAVELLNLALLKLGHSKGITALDQAAREAWTGELVYDHVLRATLRQFPWSFATKYAALSLTQGPVSTADEDDLLVQAWSNTATYEVGDVVQRSSVNYYCILEHTAQQPPNATYWALDTEETDEANGDWDYAYRWPSDCLFSRRLVQASKIGRKFDATPIPFRIGRDKNGLLIFTDEVSAVLEYTMIDCDHLWADDLWLEAFTWRLASHLAPSISKIPDMAKTCMAMAELTFQRAAVVSSREQQLEPDGDAEHIRAR